jgi:hypothetical protein
MMSVSCTFSLRRLTKNALPHRKRNKFSAAYVALLPSPLLLFFEEGELFVFRILLLYEWFHYDYYFADDHYEPTYIIAVIFIFMHSMKS